MNKINVGIALRVGVVAGLYVLVLLFSSCGGSKDNPAPSSTGGSTSDHETITIDPSNLKQEMIGFGGALTWYSDWMTGNSKVNEIADLMFTDLGIDIIRFKNWYYPDNYPIDKTTTTMSADGSNAAWTATNTLYNLAMQRNSKIKILLSSWGPPTSLKSNGQLQDGTLKKRQYREISCIKILRNIGAMFLITFHSIRITSAFKTNQLL
ncbi:MAG: hypothetical protein QM734_11905 [Cyclobacteriaceae bacterium]